MCVQKDYSGYILSRRIRFYVTLPRRQYTRKLYTTTALFRVLFVYTAGCPVQQFSSKRFFSCYRHPHPSPRSAPFVWDRACQKVIDSTFLKGLKRWAACCLKSLFWSSVPISFGNVTKSSGLCLVFVSIYRNAMNPPTLSFKVIHAVVIVLAIEQLYYWNFCKLNYKRRNDAISSEL